MSIIEKATKRLEELQRAGVVVPWAAAGAIEGQGEGPGERSLESAQAPAFQAPAGLADARTVPNRGVHRVEAGPDRLRAVAPAMASIRTSDFGLDVDGDVPVPIPMALPPRPRLERARVTLDPAVLERAGCIGPAGARSPLAEEFRHIKRPLLRNARSAEPGKDRLSLILVTSACPREGKTFTAINLALSMAMEIDTSVLLVDADVVRADLPKRLGFHAEKGLLDLLVDPQLAWSDLVLDTNVPKLSILPAGTPSAFSSELLASDAMEQLLAALAATGRERVVIFDAPPLLVTNEARTLASRVGQVLFVVEAFATPRRAVGQALAELDQCPIVLTMLNKTTEPGMPYGYGEYGG